MARQTLTLPASDFSASAGNFVNWSVSSPRLQIDSELTPTNTTRYLWQITLRANGIVHIDFDADAGDATVSEDYGLSDAFETDGGFTIVAGGQSLTVLLAGADRIEQYSFTPTNSAAVTAFVDALDNLANDSTSAELTLFDTAAPTIKYNGADLSAWKYNGTAVAAAKYNGVEL